MPDIFVTKIKEKLKLDDNLSEQIGNFLLNISFYKIAPYVNFIANNENAFKYLQSKNMANNKWEAVVYLFRYNIKLSISLYPYIFLLETILKTRINNKLTENYTDYWFRDESLFLKVNEITNMTDLSIYNKYKSIDITKQVKEDLKQDYYLLNDQLENLGIDKIGRNKINTKVEHIKRCGYIYREKEKALLENPIINCIDFIENKVTLGYWLSILTIKNLWDDGAKLKEIFPNIANIKRDAVNKKLDNIRILRNKISHHAQIIGKNKISNKKGSTLSLIDVYNDIKEIFHLLDIVFEDDFEVMELKCNKTPGCTQRSFEILYSELEEIHKYEISPQKTEAKNIEIEMSDTQSSYLKKFGYNSEERIFQVEFNQGEIYQYFSVPKFLYENMMKNETKSRGKYFIKNIRDSFKYRKIN